MEKVMSKAIQTIRSINKRLKACSVPSDGISTDTDERILSLARIALTDDNYQLIFQKFGDRWHGSLERK
jgi:hypothetical protein